MSSYDYFIGADNANLQAGGTSFLEGIGNAVTKGAGAAALSGLQSIANTGIDVSNKIFGTAATRYDTSETLHNLDANWGDYYDKNKDVIDTAGFIATSLIPGTVAVKGLKLLQSGNSAGAFAKVLGYSTRMESMYLDKALKELAVEGGTVFNQINKAKAASIAFGAADQVLQAAAFEIGVVASMKASPMLDDKSWTSIASDMATTSLFGGAIGGAFGGIFTNKLVKDVGKLVDQKQRIFDRAENIGKTSLEKGDQSFAIIDSLSGMAASVADGTIRIDHLRKGIMKDTGGTLDLTPMLEKKLQDTVSRQVEKLKGSLVNIVPDDVSVGSAFAESLVKILQEGVDAKARGPALRKAFEDKLLNLHSVEAIGARNTDVSGELRYLNPHAKIDTKADVFSSTPQMDALIGGKPVKNQPIYRTVGNEDNAKMATLGADFATEAEAFKAGFDFVLNPGSKKISVSPFSAIYKKAEDDAMNFTPMFYNTRTMQQSFDTVPTIADIATGAPGKMGGLNINIGGISSGDKSFVFKTNVYNEPATVVEATARHLWFAKLPKIYGEVASNDISALDALLTRPKGVWDTALIKDVQTGGVLQAADIPDMAQFVFKQKFEKAIELLTPKLDDAGTAKVADMRDIAYRLNVSGEWLDQAVSTKFSAKELFAHEGWQQNPLQFGNRENLILRYNTKQIDDAAMFPDGITAFHKRVQEADSRAKDAAAIVLKDHYSKLPVIAADAVARSDSQSVGPGMFTSSNADYLDELRSGAQNMGAAVKEITATRQGAVLTELQSPAIRVRQNPKAAAEIVAATEAGRLSTEPLGLYTDELSGRAFIVDLKSLKQMKTVDGIPQFEKMVPLSEDAGEFFKVWQKQHASRVEQQGILSTAQGIAPRWDPQKLYFPPVDTQRVPFFAFVHQRDASLFNTSEVGMITARDAGELKRLAAEVEKNPLLQVTFKDGSERYHKAKGDFDFGRTMNEPVIDSTLRSQGKLGNYLPNMTPEAVLEDYFQYTQRAETRLVRDAVSVNNSQLIAELQDMSARYSEVATSKMEGKSKWLQRNISDPFADTIKLMMNVNKKSEFTLWHEANEMVDALGTSTWRAVSGTVLDAKDKKITWQEANDTLTKFGLGRHFQDDMAFQVAQTAPDRNLIKGALQKANMLLANGMLKLDFANSLLNVISTPIGASIELSALKNSLKNDPAMMTLFQEMTTQGVPGTPVKIPSLTKLAYNAISNAFGETRAPLMERYKRIGVVKGTTEVFHDMMDDMSLVPGLVPSKYAAKVDEWVEKGAKITGNTQAEEYTRFFAANIMDQITTPLVKAGKMTVAEQDNWLRIYTNRVQGNYVASQRPILFQGTLGSAIGLFQTYQFNMFQQLYRHIENKDMKTLAVAAGMQGTLFGANGLPFFQAINTHIIGNASINEKHEDAYSYAVKAAGKDIGDWMMYGTASAFPAFSEQAPALWTRGDMNPRGMFIVPTSPMDVPAVQGSLKVVNAVLGMAKQVSQGADMTDAFLHGLEHNGLNRPLAGLAQVLKGNATTSKGNLISSSSDFLSIATASRLMGAKPMDDSIAVTAMYRESQYKAVTKERIDMLGSTIKDKLRNNQELSPEDWDDFMGKYAAAGGRIQGFTEAMRRWDKAANRSVVNEVMRHAQTPRGQRMIELMGGDPLQDYNMAIE